MESVHYLRALRRRWWVIVLATLVGAGVSWLVPVSSATATTAAASSKPTAYTATTVLWNPGAPLIGQGSPITNMDALATLVTLPGVSSIAAKSLRFPGTPVQLASQVSGAVDQASGFLNITATEPTPRRAVQVSTAFSEALLLYLQRLNVTRIDTQQKLVEQQIRTLTAQGVDPTVIATLRSGLSQLALNRTTPLPITILQKAVPVPVVPAAATQASSGLSVPKSRTARALIGALIGLLAGIALALVLERFDRRIRSAASAETAFGLPVLGEVPAIPRRRRNRVVTASYPYSRAADAFRLVGVGTARWATNGHAPPPDARKRAETILVTSPEPRDGKTTVAANLAVAHAQTGKRVLVVSCDLRRPAIHEAFNVAISPGVTDALRSMNGEARFDLAPYVEPCSVVRVGIVPSGDASNHPGELLGSPRMQRLLDRLRRVTDVVILDCAPLAVASDVVPLIAQADGVVLVARAGKTRDELAANAATLLERQGVEVAGVVLNDAREFSLPLAKRRMYRPDRKMRKAAKRNGDTEVVGEATQPLAEVIDEPLIVDEPPPPARPSAGGDGGSDLGVTLPEVSPTTDDRGSPGAASLATDPAAGSTSSVQLLATDDLIVLPEAEPPPAPLVEAPPAPPVVPPVPELSAPAPDNGGSKLETLQRQLAELRNQLEAFDVSLPPAPRRDVG